MIRRGAGARLRTSA